VLAQYRVGFVPASLPDIRVREARIRDPECGIEFQRPPELVDRLFIAARPHQVTPIVEISGQRQWIELHGESTFPQRLLVASVVGQELAQPLVSCRVAGIELDRASQRSLAFRDVCRGPVKARMGLRKIRIQITRSSAREMALEPGRDVVLTFKASAVHLIPH